MEKITIGENISPCHMVIQNHGPGRIGVYAGYGDQIVLEPGQLRLTYAWIGLFVESKDKKSSLIEMDFMPAFR
jgi:hypothetical protein